MIGLTEDEVDKAIELGEEVYELETDDDEEDDEDEDDEDEGDDDDDEDDDEEDEDEEGYDNGDECKEPEKGTNVLIEDCDEE